ncbi:sensor histidine kinase [Paenibacillus mucilaginosus]|uniref:histidine kinase n=1 Tax=Paenibacillus mucilaginosus (strain KNP414) TaxID=1036673 RepID=F8F5D2_PAEMK|nr:ATP-binding protein [Paenibacillus mucilaginosus]AEI40943.1 DctS [Paenibacillus mucilaginosus KNP414]MCG7211606.1 ATP-binding protein [Paenibacillus mucilaginosus]WDM30031.1 GHKL domain-containing protein [Paenibacillus mucilaginosus]
MLRRLFPSRPERRRWKPSLSMLLISLIIVLLTNSVFYYYTKNRMTRELEERLQLISDVLAVSIEHARAGEKHVEDLIGLNLRSVSIAAQSQLPADIEQVSNEELQTLSRQLMVDHITLMKRQGDDIVGYRSSDPKEIGMSTKDWRGDWFKAFNQLLDRKETQVPSGQALPNYWSGPINTSMTNPSSVDKWGYYHDGSTNYITDPFVHDTHLRSYQRDTGVDAFIREMTREDRLNAASEITVYNPPTFLKEQEQYRKDAFTWFSDREILFGSYTLKDSRDASSVREVMRTGQKQEFTTVLDGHTYLKMFIPLGLEYPAVIGLTADYEPILDWVREQQTQLTLLIGSTIFIGLLTLFLSARVMSRSRERTAESVQEVYTDKIDDLFRSMKEQQHDFNNHVAALSALVQLKQYEELTRYTEQLTEETHALNDIIQINVPALCAIVQAKLIESAQRKIRFTHDVENLSGANLGALKATDLVKVVSNLLDNAFDAVSASPRSDKHVGLTGRLADGRLQFVVANNGEPIPVAVRERLFEAGFTTKTESGDHEGLGLSIVQSILSRYKGQIEVHSSEAETRFVLSIPV